MGEELAATWNIDFYREDDGTFPVRTWLGDLSEEVRGKVIARVDLLKKGGPTVDYPYTSQIEGRLREARLRMGKTRYRVLYFFDQERTAILLHGFTKNTAAVEETDKRIGRTRMAKHEARLAAKRAGSGAGKQRGKKGT
ncbi:MAG: type II toxin-antitoxin system RelE/ParE family toxin [Terriglobales bacterium]